jgi:gamma-glutamylcyclotransferase (GGCT)/AIG2-like uncharacterized protein YtfP
MKVFVYGTLLTGFGNNGLLRNSKLLGEQVLEGFDMYSLGAYPVITPGKGRVQGEVYEVDDAVLGRLDRLEGYPNFYNRMKVQIDNTDTWVYFMENPVKAYAPHGRQLATVDSGSWRAERFPKSAFMS